MKKNWQKIQKDTVLYCIKEFEVTDASNSWQTFQIKKHDKITIVEKGGNFCLVDSSTLMFEKKFHVSESDAINNLFGSWTHKTQLTIEQINKNFILEIEAKLDKLLEE